MWFFSFFCAGRNPARLCTFATIFIRSFVKPWDWITTTAVLLKLFCPLIFDGLKKGKKIDRDIFWVEQRGSSTNQRPRCFFQKKIKNTQKSFLNFLSSSSQTLSAWFSVQSNIKRNNFPLPLKTKLSPYLRAAARTKTETKNQPGAQKSKFPKQRSSSSSSCWETKPTVT